MCTIGIAIGLVLAGSTQGYSTTVASATQTDVCNSPIFIGVRGLTAPGGSGKSEDGYGWTSGGMGDVVDATRKNWVARTSVLGVKTLTLSLNYNSSVIGMNAPNLDAAATKLASMLNYYARKCGPVLPAVYIAAHSMGAAVVTIALNKSAMTPQARTMIRGVALFGNPYYWGKDRLWNDSLSPKSGFGLWTLNNSGIAKNISSGIWSVYQNRVQDYCLAKDYVCQDGQAVDNTVHSSYNASSVGRTSRAVGRWYSEFVRVARLSDNDRRSEDALELARQASLASTVVSTEMQLKTLARQVDMLGVDLDNK